MTKKISGNVASPAEQAIIDALRNWIEQIVKEKLEAAGVVQAAPDPESIRIQRGFSITALADAAGIANSSIGRIERGETLRPSPEILAKIASALGVPAQEYRASVARKIEKVRAELRTLDKLRKGSK